MLSDTSVQAAIAAVVAELPSIQKSDSGDGVAYKFRGVETLVGHLAPLLAKHGVVIVPQTKLLEINRDVENSKGKMPGWTETLLEVTWNVYGPKGDKITATTVGIGRDNSDKGANKAQTQAFKYLLMELFAIGDKADDADGISNDPKLIPAEVAEKLNEQIKTLGATRKAEVAEQLKQIGGSVFIAKMGLDLLPAVLAVVIAAVAEESRGA